MNASYLIRNAQAVLSGDAGSAARLRASDIRVADGVITEIGQGLVPAAGERVLDAGGCVVYPGWVNTHHHLFQSLLKGVPAGIDLTLGPWLKAVPYRYRHGFDEARLRLAARVGLVELMLSGCTTVADHHYIFPPGQSYDAAAVLFDEAERLGLRFMLLRGGATVTRSLEVDARLRVEPESLDQMLASVERTVQQFHQRGARAMRRVALAPTTVNVSVRTAELVPLARAGRAMGVPLHSHMSESVATIEQCRAAFGRLPIEYLAEHEWLGPDVFLAHVVHVSESERRLLGESGTGIAHCPQSNARLADGIAPAPALAALGARIGLGVDGAASNEAADMISEAHVCWLVHRALAGSASRAQPEGAGEAGADAVTAEQVLHWGTASGAAMLGFEGVGRVAVGQAADLAVYGLDQPRYFGLHDPALGPIVSGGRPRLRWLLVDGRIVVEDDAIPGLDLGELRAQAAAAVAALIREG
ncbi:MAG: amidohydrolase family protein [Burkholderiales bacterium]|nr:amidohydrolase family protein [Burkholderiales bacterium]